jgi:hypothetical protein
MSAEYDACRLTFFPLLLPLATPVMFPVGVGGVGVGGAGWFEVFVAGVLVVFLVAMTAPC